MTLDETIKFLAEDGVVHPEEFHKQSKRVAEMVVASPHAMNYVNNLSFDALMQGALLGNPIQHLKYAVLQAFQLGIRVQEMMGSSTGFPMKTTVDKKPDEGGTLQ